MTQVSMFAGRRSALLISLLLLCGVISPLFAQDGDERLFKEAELRFRKGDYLFALDRYDELIEEFPLSAYIPDAQFRRAVIFYRTGRAVEALSLFQRIGRRFPAGSYTELLPFWIGLCRYSLEEYGKAAESLSSYLEQSSGRLASEAGRYLALSYKAQGLETEAADAALAAYEAQTPGGLDPALLSLTLSLLLDAGRADQVITMMADSPVEAFPAPWASALSFYKAEALFRRGEQEASIPYYEQSLNAPPKTSGPAYQRLYSLYRDFALQDKRSELFDRAQLALAGEADLLNRFLLQAGIEQFGEENLELAASYFRRVLRSSSDTELLSVSALYLSRLLFQQGEEDEAVGLLERYQEKESDGQLLFTLAVFLAEQERYAAALERLELFIARYPDSEFRAEAEYLRAYLYYRTARYSKALSLIEHIYASGYTGADSAKILRLKSRVHIGLEDYAAGIRDLQEYIPLSDSDSEAELDLLRLYYRLGRYGDITERAPDLLSRYPQKSESVQYLLALSLLARKEYEKSLDSFHLLLDSEPDPEILPYALFYSAWSAYKIERYDIASERFFRMADEFSDHELAERSIYFGAWSYFSRKEYARAAEAFGRYGQMAGGEAAEQGIFMYAKSYAAAGEPELAAAAYQGLIELKRSEYSDDALYEYAQLMQRRDRHDEALRAYLELWNRDKSSPFAEDALYNRAELFYLSSSFREAGEAFAFYRRHYPQGRFQDLALYYGGQTAKARDEAYRAVLLWEKLIDEESESDLYGEALQRLAETYREVGDYRRSLAYYSRIVSLYPEQAKRISAENEIATISRILEGAGVREAELERLVEEEGLSSSSGADAHLELAGRYLNRYDRREQEARQLLLRLADDLERYPAQASRALLQLGDIASAEAKLKDAVNYYLDGAAAASEDDLAAKALFRAAETANRAGDRVLLRRVVRRIESDFPDSEWAVRARALLEDE